MKNIPADQIEELNMDVLNGNMFIETRTDGGIGWYSNTKDVVLYLNNQQMLVGIIILNLFLK